MNWHQGFTLKHLIVLAATLYMVVPLTVDRATKWSYSNECIKKFIPPKPASINNAEAWLFTKKKTKSTGVFDSIKTRKRKGKKERSLEYVKRIIWVTGLRLVFSYLYLLFLISFFGGELTLTCLLELIMKYMKTKDRVWYIRLACAMQPLSFGGLTYYVLRHLDLQLSFRPIYYCSNDTILVQARSLSYPSSCLQKSKSQVHTLFYPQSTRQKSHTPSRPTWACFLPPTWARIALNHLGLPCPRSCTARPYSLSHSRTRLSRPQLFYPTHRKIYLPDRPCRACSSTTPRRPWRFCRRRQVWKTRGEEPRWLLDRRLRAFSEGLPGKGGGGGWLVFGTP